MDPQLDAECRHVLLRDFVISMQSVVLELNGAVCLHALNICMCSSTAMPVDASAVSSCKSIVTRALSTRCEEGLSDGDQQSKSKGGGSSASGIDDMPLIPKELVTQYLEMNDN